MPTVGTVMTDKADMGQAGMVAATAAESLFKA